MILCFKTVYLLFSEMPRWCPGDTPAIQWKVIETVFLKRERGFIF